MAGGVFLLVVVKGTRPRALRLENRKHGLCMEKLKDMFLF